MECNVHDIQKENCNLWYNKPKPTIVSVFWYDLKLWSFSQQNKKSDRICTFKKFYKYLTKINTKHCDVEGQLQVFLVTFCKTICSKIPFHEKVMTTKTLVILGSFVIVGLFDYVLTHSLCCCFMTSIIVSDSIPSFSCI